MKPFFLALSMLAAGALAAQTPQTNLQNANPQAQFIHATALPLNINALMPSINYPVGATTNISLVADNNASYVNNDAYVSMSNISNVSNVSLTNVSYVQGSRGNINDAKQNFSTVEPINAFDNNVQIENNKQEPEAIVQTNKDEQVQVQTQAKSAGKERSFPSLSLASRSSSAADAPAARASSSRSSAHHAHRGHARSPKMQRFFQKMKGGGHYRVSECFHF